MNRSTTARGAEARRAATWQRVAFLVALVIVGGARLSAAEERRVACAREFPWEFIGVVEARVTPSLARDGTYVLRIRSASGESVQARLVWELPSGLEGYGPLESTVYVPSGGELVVPLGVRVSAAGDYAISAALISALAQGRDGTPERFVRYLRVRRDASTDSASPFAIDPQYVPPLRAEVHAVQAAGVGADQTAYLGTFTYHDDTTGYQEPIREARMQLAEQVQSGDFLIETIRDEVVTDVDGRFEFGPVPSANIVGQPRVYRVKALMENDAVVVTDHRKRRYERTSQWLQAEPGKLVQLELRWELADGAHLVGFMFDAVLDARDSLIASVGFQRTKIRVEYPSLEGASYYYVIPRGDLISDEAIAIAFNDGARRPAILHEYGHAVMTHLYGDRYDNLPFGIYEGPHSLYTVSDEEFAINEGWAEFIEAAVDDSALNVTGYLNAESPNIESNSWWTGRVNGTGTNTRGEIVEGAVASILWDVTDGPQSLDLQLGVDDDRITNRIGYLWQVFEQVTPFSILEFRDGWLDRGFPDESALLGIFADHGVPAGTPPTVEFASAGQRVQEGLGPVTATVRLSWISGSEVTVPYTVSGTADFGSDHDLSAGVLRIAAGETSASITFSLVGDTVTEEPETVVIAIEVGGLVNATPGGITSHVVTIDPPPPTWLYVGSQSAYQGEVFSTSIYVQDVAELTAFQVSLRFDPAVLHVLNVEMGSALLGSDWQRVSKGYVDNGAGVVSGIYVVQMPPEGVSGSGALLIVDFQAQSPGQSALRLENAQLTDSSGNTIPTLVLPGTVTVGAGPEWDINLDGIVDIRDLVLVATGRNPRADVNGDGSVDIRDLVMVASHFGERWGSATTAPKLPVAADFDAVRRWLDQARAADDGSSYFRRGIEVLEQLVRTTPPSRTVLLSNYPNPFNPETWIPFRLAQASRVSLTVADLSGRQVRTWNLGTLPAGDYTGRETAVRWDGHTDTGEPAPSGAYWVMLDAGSTRAVRKIVLLK